MAQMPTGSQWLPLAEESSGESEQDADEVDELISSQQSMNDPIPSLPPPMPTTIPKTPSPSKKRKRSPEPPTPSTERAPKSKATPKGKGKLPPGTPAQKALMDNFFKTTTSPEALRGQLQYHGPDTPTTLPPTRSLVPSPRKAPPFDYTPTKPSTSAAGAPPSDAATPRPAPSGSAAQHLLQHGGKSADDAISLLSDDDDPNPDANQSSPIRPAVLRPPAAVRRGKPAKEQTSSEPSKHPATQAAPYLSTSTHPTASVSRTAQAGPSLPTSTNPAVPVSRTAAHAMRPRPQPARIARPPAMGSPPLRSRARPVTSTVPNTSKGKGRAASQSSSSSLPDVDDVLAETSPTKRSQAAPQTVAQVKDAPTPKSPNVASRKRKADVIDLTMTDEEDPPPPRKVQRRRRDSEQPARKAPITKPPDYSFSSGDSDASPRRPVKSNKTQIVTPAAPSTSKAGPSKSSSSSLAGKDKVSSPSKAASAGKANRLSSVAHVRSLPTPPSSVESPVRPLLPSPRVAKARDFVSNAPTDPPDSIGRAQQSSVQHAPTHKSPFHEMSSNNAEASTSAQPARRRSLVSPDTTPPTGLSPEQQLFRQSSLTSDTAVASGSSVQAASDHDEVAVLPIQALLQGTHVLESDAECSNSAFRWPSIQDFDGLGPVELHRHIFGLTADQINADAVVRLFEGHMSDASLSEPPPQIVREPDDPCLHLWLFRYSNEILHAPGVPEVDDSELEGCDCEGPCEANINCACAVRQAKMTGKECPTFEHDHNGRLNVIRKAKKKEGIDASIILECNKHCKCSDDCPNRVIQRGREVEVRLQKTEGKGWGVFAGQRIPRGTFVGIYAGELLKEDMAEKRGFAYDRSGFTYLFDIDFGHLRKEVVALAEGEISNNHLIRAKRWKNLYAIDAYRWGNFTRFFNHSCDPNLMIHAAYTNEPDIEKPLLAFYATKDIPEGQELCFSYYGDSPADVDSDDESGSVKSAKTDGSTASIVPKAKTEVHKPCLCGSRNCRGRMFCYNKIPSRGLPRAAR